MLSVTYASCSPWRTSTIRSPGSGNAARSSSARWSSTKIRIVSATSGAPKEFSSGLPKSSGGRLPDDLIQEYFNTPRTTAPGAGTNGFQVEMLVRIAEQECSDHLQIAQGAG